MVNRCYRVLLKLYGMGIIQKQAKYFNKMSFSLSAEGLGSED